MSDTAEPLARNRAPVSPALPFSAERLARRAAAGDERAFAAIYKRYHQSIYRYCLAILRDPEDAQDALQATMERALRALPGEGREIALKPWLFRVAHNEAITLVRRRRPTAELDGELAHPGGTPEQRAATRERLRELIRDLDQLPERQRGALVMRELNGLSYETIAEAFGVSAAAAKQAVYEARVALTEMSEGRERDCDSVRAAISAGDRRLLRGRRIRAHLRSCAGCSDFQAAIGRRGADLSALAPPLAAPLAVAALHSLVGGAAGAKAGGVAIGSGVGAAAAVKAGVAALVAASVVVGAGELTGTIDLGHSDRQQNPNPASPAEPSDGVAGPEASPTTGSAQAGTATTAASAAQRASGHRDRGAGQGRDHRPGDGDGHGHQPQGQSAQAGGNPSPPGQTATPGNSPAVPPGQTGTPPGHTDGGPSPHASATGQAHSQGAASSSGSSSSSSSVSGHGGGTATAPGQTGAAPGQSGTAGNSANAPGHQK